jgi:DNA-binding CsgD family transcriptional regulator
VTALPEPIGRHPDWPAAARRLSDRARHVMRVAAVLGPAFRLRDAADLLETRTATLLPVVDEALDSGVLRDCGDRLAFESLTVWRSVLESVPSAVACALGDDVERLTGASPAMSTPVETAVPGTGPAGRSPHVLLWAGRIDEASEVADEVLATDDAPTALQEARAARLFAQHLCDPAAAGVVAEAAMAGRRGAEHSADVVAAMMVLADVRWNDGDLAGALRLAREAERQAKAGPSAELFLPWCTTADKLGAVGLADEAAAELCETEELIRRLDLHAHAAYPRVRRARLLLRHGHLDAAAEQATAGMVIAQGVGAALAVPVALCVLAAVALRHGDLTTAEHRVAEYRALLDRAAALPSPQYDWVELRLVAEQHGPERAVGLLRGRLAGLLDSAAVFADEPGSAAMFVRLGVATGDRDVAAAAVKRIEQLAGGQAPSSVQAVAAAHARGLLDADRTLLARAAMEHRDPWAAACATKDLEAWHLTRDAGTGGPMPRIPSGAGTWSAWAQLSEREAAVARLAAEGLTNQQIARRLRVSPYTVNYHLRGVYRKLEIRSRVELAHHLP